MNWNMLFAVLAAMFIIYLLVRNIRANPNMLSKENLSKSFGTMGLLAVGLIVFVVILVWLTRIV